MYDTVWTVYLLDDNGIDSRRDRAFESREEAESYIRRQMDTGEHFGFYIVDPVGDLCF